MGRKRNKRKAVKDLRGIDATEYETVLLEDGAGSFLRPTESALEYWDEILRRRRLSMDEGRDPGHRNVLSVGNSMNLEAIYEMEVGARSGKVRPNGHGPDQFEPGD